MIFYVVMKKLQESNGITYYHIVDYIGKKEFYLGVDPLHKQLFYFEEPDFDNPEKVINFSDPNKPMEIIPGISHKVSNWVIANLSKAAAGGNFPGCIYKAS